MFDPKTSSKSLFKNFKKFDSQNVITRMNDFERQLCAQNSVIIHH